MRAGSHCDAIFRTIPRTSAHFRAVPPSSGNRCKLDCGYRVWWSSLGHRRAPRAPGMSKGRRLCSEHTYAPMSSSHYGRARGCGVPKESVGSIETAPEKSGVDGASGSIGLNSVLPSFAHLRSSRRRLIW